MAALVIVTFAYVRNGVGPARHEPPVPATPLSRPLNVSNDTPVASDGHVITHVRDTTSYLPAS